MAGTVTARGGMSRGGRLPVARVERSEIRGGVADVSFAPGLRFAPSWLRPLAMLGHYHISIGADGNNARVRKDIFKS